MRGRIPHEVLTALTLVVVGASVATRLVHRGADYPGWDVAGAAHGLHLVSTMTARQLVDFYADRLWRPGLFWNVFGIPVALLPGWLASVLPWARWPHLLTPCFLALALALLARALSLGFSRLWMLLLPLGASPALLSYAVAGFPYITNTLPYALAIWIVFRWRRAVLATAALCLFTMALSWHVQELGRTAFVVLVLAAVCLPDVRPSTRATWLVCAGVWCWLAVTNLSGNTARYAAMGMPPLSTLPLHAWSLARHFAQGGPDLPYLVVAGAIAAASVPRERWFWSALMLVQAGLVFLLAANAGILQGIVAVWPRRVLLLGFVALAACAAAFRRRAGGVARVAIVSILVLGNVGQAWMTARWAARPLDADGAPEYAYALPYTHTPLDPDVPVAKARALDSRVSFLLVRWHAEMEAELRQGRKLLLIYNLTSFDENATDPAGIIDRLYLGLGPERFSESVFVFGRHRIMTRELPIRPLETFGKFVDAIADSDVYRAYWVHHPKDDRDWAVASRHREEVALMFTTLGARFRLEWLASTHDPHGRALHRFLLRSRTGDVPLAGAGPP
jgi:hypothetical protein